MSLINCLECGHQVSDRAVSCPQCGCPIGTGHQSIEVASSKHHNGRAECPSCSAVYEEGLPSRCSNCGLLFEGGQDLRDIENMAPNQRNDYDLEVFTGNFSKAIWPRNFSAFLLLPKTGSSMRAFGFDQIADLSLVRVEREKNWGAAFIRGVFWSFAIGVLGFMVIGILAPVLGFILGMVLAGRSEKAFFSVSLSDDQFFSGALPKKTWSDLEKRVIQFKADILNRQETGAPSDAAIGLDD